MPRATIAAVAAAVFAFTLVCPGADTASAGPAATDTAYFDGFLDLIGIDPFKSVDVELDALGGVRMKGDGAPEPAAWTEQADFEESISYRPRIFVDNPLIPLATMDAAATPGSLVLPSTPRAFRRLAPGPVFAPSAPPSVDGYSVGGMCVRRVDLDYRYYMWYTGVPENEHAARIYLAKSDNGIDWVRAPKTDPADPLVEIPVLDLGEPGTFDSRQLGKPSVIYDPLAPPGKPKFKMWYTAEGDLTGSIGYATSDDGVNWSRWEQPVVTLDGPEDVGRHASLAVGADGAPNIAYYDASNADLKFVRCGNAFCSDGNTAVTIDSEGDVGTYASLAIAGDGLPTIAYYDATNTALKVVHCGTAACTVGNAFATVDGAGDPGVDAGRYASLAMDANGLPAIAYHDATGGDLKFVKCTDYGCSGGDELPVALDGAGEANVGQHASLAFVAPDPLVATLRTPAIAYYDATAGDLKYLVCNDELCAGADETVTTVDAATSDVGQYASLAVGPAGLPAIAYYDATATALKLLACNDALCAGADDLPVVLDDAAGTDTGSFGEVVFGAAGNPVVAYYDATNGDLVVRECADATCGAAGAPAVGEPFVVDGPDDVGQHLSLVAFAGTDPRIAYYDLTNGDLKFASSRRQTLPVLGPGIIGSVDSFSVAHPAVLYDADAAMYRMWYTANDSNNRRIAYATSPDGVTWARSGVAINLGTGNIALGVWSPSVTKGASGYTMIYTGWKQVSGGMTVQAKLMEATSTLGTTWTYGPGGVALNPGNASEFDGTNLSQGSVIYDPLDADAPYKMWYVGNTEDEFGNFHDRIGYATAKATGGWGKVPGTAGLKAVMGFGTLSTAFDSMHAFDLRVVPDPQDLTGATLLGFYAGKNVADFKDRIGVRSSVDGGLTWEDDGTPAALAPLGAAHDAGGALTPAPVSTGSGWLIYYTALDAAREPSIGLYEAPVDLSTATPAAAPVLGAGSGFEAGGCADPWVVTDGTAMTLYYAGVDSAGVWSIARATGDTGTPEALTKAGQILAPGPAAYDLGGLRRPVAWNDTAAGTWRLWYTAIGEDGVERIALASSTDGATWTKDGLAVMPSTAPYDFAEKGVWPASVWAGAEAGSVMMALTGVDRFGWRRGGILASAGAGFAEGATATFQTPDDATLGSAGYLPRDWRTISWNPPAIPEGSGLEVWVSYYPTYSGLWSNFFPIANGRDLPFLLTVKGMRWQLRAAGHPADVSVTPQVDDLTVDNAAIAFPATATAATIPVGPPVGRYLLTWVDLSVAADVPAGGSLAVRIADQEGTELVADQPVGTGISLAALPGTSGPLQLIFTFTPASGTTPPKSPLLASVTVTYTSTDVPSSITLTATPNPLRYKETATLSGWLTSDTTPLGGQTVRLKRRLVTETAYTDMGEVTTDPVDGSFTWGEPLEQLGDTIYRAEWDGNVDIGGTIYPPAVESFTLAMAPTEFTLAAARNPLPYGRSTTLAGSFVTGGVPLAGETLTLRSRPLNGTTFTDLGTMVTGADGSFAWPTAVAPKKSTVYQASWQGGAVVAELTLGVKPLLTIALSGQAAIVGKYNRYKLGTTAVIAGTVKPAHYLQGDGVTRGRATVEIQRLVAGTWRPYAQYAKALSTRSTYTHSWRPTKLGTYRVRALFLGDADHAASRSVFRYVQVY